jgi:predicted kinase
MKTIVIGPSLSGKTTLVKQLRSTTNLPISEIDEELTRLNNGEYPSDSDYKNRVLVPHIVQQILSQNEIIFFTNTNYFSIDDLKLARQKGFKIVVLSLSLEELQKRNISRVKNEGYADQSQWFAGMLKYLQQIIDEGVVDKVIDGNQSQQAIIEDLLQ